MVEENWQSALSEYVVDPNIKAQVRNKFNFRPFKQAPASKVHQDNLITLDSLDFSKYREGPEGFKERKELAKQLEGSVTKYGFFALQNFGISQEWIDEILSLSQSTFEEPDEVKSQFIGGEHNLPEEEGRPLGIVKGTGYKPLGYWKYTNDTPDQVEAFNLRHFGQFDTFFNRTKYPEFVKGNLDVISFFFNYIHREVLRRVLNLFDLILERPEGTLYEQYFLIVQGDLKRSPDGWGRFLYYHPVSDDYNMKASNVWMRGHTDSSALTFILSQSILSLQIREHDTNEWKYVGHTPGALIVNIGDMFQQLTGGYFKSSIHRVITAPEDQRGYYRNTAIYFCYPVPYAYLDPDSLASPKLKRLGYKRDESQERITVRQWSDAKGTFFNKSSGANRTKDISLFGRPSVGSLIGEDVPEAATNVWINT
ncbi:DEKNAAC100646 [Brettanomyces naardenensis]|uniref:DEKNAAC100646 n=1 Tax=Brettanomyces naardenensis TaxID=13370 RepID=A0A448YG72_BRENA|nr:DEKNAAC100646 [Brettanomyces naardenensis]